MLGGGDGCDGGGDGDGAGGGDALKFCFAPDRSVLMPPDAGLADSRALPWHAIHSHCPASPRAPGWPTGDTGVCGCWHPRQPANGALRDRRRSRPTRLLCLLHRPSRCGCQGGGCFASRRLSGKSFSSQQLPISAKTFWIRFLEESSCRAVWIYLCIYFGLICLFSFYLLPGGSQLQRSFVSYLFI